MRAREVAIVLLFVSALSFALASWAWRMTSLTYPRNDSAPIHSVPLPYVPPP